MPARTSAAVPPEAAKRFKFLDVMLDSPFCFELSCDFACGLNYCLLLPVCEDGNPLDQLRGAGHLQPFRLGRAVEEVAQFVQVQFEGERELALARRSLRVDSPRKNKCPRQSENYIPCHPRASIRFHGVALLWKLERYFFAHRVRREPRAKTGMVAKKFSWSW